jgi:predicted MFS family arabinose efflux permease
LLNGLSADYNWHIVIIIVSIIAALGGLLILLLVPDGPYRKKGLSADLRTAFTIFKNKQFRSAAFGYFGHMWELYTFWALVPVILTAYTSVHTGAIQNISVASFIIIGVGSLACVTSGYIAMKKGSAQTAFAALLISCVCCLSANMFMQLPVYVFLPFMLLWGMAVVADSPQFTTTGAQLVDATVRGSAMTLTNSIGFAVTVVSIQTMSLLQSAIGLQYVFYILAVGPLLGLIAMRKLVFS